MATLIRATCSDCGDVELGTRDLVVRLCETNEAGTYVFRCPNCDHPVVRPADRPTIDLLISPAGGPRLWPAPEPLRSPPGRAPGAVDTPVGTGRAAPDRADVHPRRPDRLPRDAGGQGLVRRAAGRPPA